jgi:hypothetical protein
VKNLIRNGFPLQYVDLEKVVPIEFAEFHQQVENMKVYLKLNNKEVDFEKLMDWLSLRDMGLNKDKHIHHIEVVIDNLIPYYVKLKESFLSNTGLRMWFRYDSSYKKAVVGFLGVPKKEF